MGAPCDAVFPFVTYEMVKTRQDDVMIRKVEQQESNPWLPAVQWFENEVTNFLLCTTFLLISRESFGAMKNRLLVQISKMICNFGVYNG